tara:strand:+ start:692 stop:820 length:129 start_codon:yes stop_codon:yes gene_type:complete
LNKEVESGNEYAKYRKWLIAKEKEFVESQGKKAPVAIEPPAY